MARKRNCLDGVFVAFDCFPLATGWVGEQQAHLSSGPLGFAGGSSTASFFLRSAARNPLDPSQIGLPDKLHCCSLPQCPLVFSLRLSRGTVIFLIYFLIGGNLFYSVVLVFTVLDVSFLSEKADVLSVGTALGNLSC